MSAQQTIFVGAMFLRILMDSSFVNHGCPFTGNWIRLKGYLPQSLLNIFSDILHNRTYISRLRKIALEFFLYSACQIVFH